MCNVLCGNICSMFKKEKNYALFVIRMTWRIRMCGATRFCVWHDTFRCVAWLIYRRVPRLMCVLGLICMWNDTFVCVAWLLHTCAIICFYRPVGIRRSSRGEGVVAHVCHDSYAPACTMTHSFVCHILIYIYAPWLIYPCTMTHSYVCRYTMSHGTYSCIHAYTGISLRHVSFICMTSRIHMCAMTSSHLCHFWHLSWRFHICAASCLQACWNSRKLSRWVQRAFTGSRYIYLHVYSYIHVHKQAHSHIYAHIPAPSLIHMYDITQSYVCHDFFTFVPFLTFVLTLSRWCCLMPTGLLKFSEAKPLGAKGFYWLKVYLFTCVFIRTRTQTSTRTHIRTYIYIYICRYMYIYIYI